MPHRTCCGVLILQIFWGMHLIHCPVDSLVYLQRVPGGGALENLERADNAWKRLCDATVMPFKEVIRETREPLQAVPGMQHLDVIVLGGVCTHPGRPFRC